MFSFNLDRISYFKQKNLNKQHVPQIRATVIVLQITVGMFKGFRN